MEKRLNMISYDRFEDYMLRLKQIMEADDKIDSALKSISPEFGGFQNEIAIDLVLDMLRELTHDKYGNISYYIWEINWGEDWEYGMVTDEFGYDIPMKTLKDLYKLLEEEYEE